MLYIPFASELSLKTKHVKVFPHCLYFKPQKSSFWAQFLTMTFKWLNPMPPHPWPSLILLNLTKFPCPELSLRPVIFCVIAFNTPHYSYPFAYLCHSLYFLHTAHQQYLLTFSSEYYLCTLPLFIPIQVRPSEFLIKRNWFIKIDYLSLWHFQNKLCTT